MNDKPVLVWVVIPAYNAAATIEETLFSASAQDYLHLEIIVVDDTSTDETVNMAASFKGVHQVRVVRQSNAGVASAPTADSRRPGASTSPSSTPTISRTATKQVNAFARSRPHALVFCFSRAIQPDGRICLIPPRRAGAATFTPP